MPKQIYKIDNFHGGLNTDADPRDVADNELPVLTDLVVDEVGKIRMMGGGATQGAPDPVDHTLRAGYGLFYFSADRKGGHVRGVDLTGTHTGSGNSAFLVDSGSAWPVDGLIGATVNNTTDGSTITISDNTATTVTGTLAGGTDNDWDASDAYTITGFAETGDDYLIAVDCDATAASVIYSRTNDKWSPSVYPIDIGSTADVEPTFYAVDGGLRFSDGNFGVTNNNQWYSHISREFLQTLGGNSVSVDKWTNLTQKIDKPAATSRFNESISAASTTYSTEYVTLSETDDTATKKFETEDQIYDDSNAQKVGDYAGGAAGFSNVGKIVVVVTATADESTNNNLDYTVTAGEGASSGSAFTSDSQSQSVTGTVTHGYYRSFTFEFNVTGTEAIEIANGEGTQGVLVTLTDNGNGSAVNDFQIDSAKAFEGVFAGSTHANLAANNVIFEIDDDTDSSALGWDKDWNVGVSFIYDEAQESLITELLDTDNATETVTIASGKAPDIKLSIKYSGWNERITGINLYMREATTITKESWYLQTHYDLIKGIGRAYPNGTDNDFSYESSIAESQCTVPKEQLLEPNLVDHYELVAGMKPDERSIISKYKSAVVVNRVVYIGGLEVEYEDGETEVMSDAMIKSPVNKFDLFPLSRIIEVSVRDGDSIVKLEEYADRILQFKKHKMHLVNVSQEVEFLEDTFVHKGVSTPAAVCKTDFGVAWVNQHGCYFYDGNRVNNLLEKGGRRLISDDDWEGFITVKDDSDGNPGGSMIGYIPKKRQLVVVKDSFANSNSGDIFLYDMVTQSWTSGKEKFKIDGGAERRKTNFVNDWNGDLVHINDYNSGTVYKWDDAADGTGNVSFRTKDIVFGQPAQRKKVYRVRISYKGDADSLTIKYSVNGDTDTLYDFEGTASDGTPTGSTDTTPLLDKTDLTVWHHAELKPDTSSEASNIYSFQLHITGTADTDFEINDISIVYRLKNIK